MERITADNFITDNKTNKVFISSLIDGETGGLDVDARTSLKASILKFARNGELLYNTLDVWSRDYMPIQLTHDAFLSFTYNPDYLQDSPDYVTNWQVHRVHSKKQIAKEVPFDFNVVQLPLILDGGNVVKAIVNDKPCIIMCDKVLYENNLKDEKEFQKWWNNWWKDNFDGTEMQLVLLPWEGKNVNPIGHADGIVRFIEDGRVLLTNYFDFDEKFGTYYGGLYQKKLEETGFKVETLSYLDKFDYSTDKMFRLLFNHSWCYINYLHVGNKILVPKLEYEPLDNEAIRQIDRAFNTEKHIADIQLIDVDMTSIVEDMGGGPNSGGALNCLTWTIME